MPPPQSVFDGRLNNLTRIGYLVAENTSATIEAKYGSANCVTVANANVYQRLNARYWDLVDDFKSKNYFPDGNRINSPKKAAITTYAVATNPEPLFLARTSLDQSHVDYAVLRYCLTAMEMFMGVDVRTISMSHKRDLNSCIFKMHDEGADSVRQNLHLLCLYMDTYWSPNKESVEAGVDD